MHGYIRRLAEGALRKALQCAPVVALLGPRQCGKSTLAKEFLKSRESTYVDLQDRVGRNRLTEPELFFEHHRDHLICLDEIQQLPELFSTLCSEVDRDRRPGRFLILGSASRDLIRQSTETMAGRIAYLDLTPFFLCELPDTVATYEHWIRGGFPDSLLAGDEEASFDWRQDFIRTFLERDIPSLGVNISVTVMERFWRMLAHYHGQTINWSKLAESVSVSVPTLKRYLGILEQTYMIRRLQPFEKNLKKRLVKSPKVYIRDSGILHGLLDVEDYDHLLGHPAMGASWEGYAMENIISVMPKWRPSYIRTSNGAEVDLVMERGERQVLFEFKASKAPRATRGFFEIRKILEPESAFLIAPVDIRYEYQPGVEVASPRFFQLD
ncbi:ATPase [bacterium M21]|nr:ATPase [bacterium M21]